MCVIIHREPNVEIPFQKLESACLVNADGMGIVTVDRGKLHVRKHFFEKGNDPEFLAKALEDNKAHHTYVHLRYKTRGAKDKDNVHPFGVLTMKKHGMELQFMHNGTLSDFGDVKTCDSKDFAKSILTPLSEGFMKAGDPNGFILDPAYNKILKQFAGRSSIFLLGDNFGNVTIVNESDGKEFEGWWASNEYSFNRYHRSSTNYSSGGYSSGWERDYDGDYKKMYGSQASSEKKVVSLPALPPSNTTSNTGATGAAKKPPFNDDVPFTTAKSEAKKEAEVKKAVVFPKRQTFCELSGLQSLSDVCGLSYLEIEDMVDEHPDMASLLILDLLKELYDRDQEYDDRADYEKSVA